MARYLYSAVEVYDVTKGKWELKSYYTKDNNGDYRPAQLLTGGVSEFEFLTGATDLSSYLDDHDEPDETIDIALNQIGQIIDGCMEYGGLPQDASDELKEYFNGFITEIGGQKSFPRVTQYTLCELLLIRECVKGLPPIGRANFDRYFAPVVALLYMIYYAVYLTKSTHIRVLLWLK